MLCVVWTAVSCLLSLLTRFVEAICLLLPCEQHQQAPLLQAVAAQWLLCCGVGCNASSATHNTYSMPACCCCSALTLHPSNPPSVLVLPSWQSPTGPWKLLHTTLSLMRQAAGKHMPPVLSVGFTGACVCLCHCCNVIAVLRQACMLWLAHLETHMCNSVRLIGLSTKHHFALLGVQGGFRGTCRSPVCDLLSCIAGGACGAVQNTRTLQERGASSGGLPCWLPWVRACIECGPVLIILQEL
jgi:hypothetical protein